MNPIPETILKIFGTFLCFSGIGTLSRFTHTLSPKTPFEAQLLVDLGGENILGFTYIQIKPKITRIIEYHPNTTLLHKARTSIGVTVLLVTTLQGLECLFQVLSSILKEELIFLSKVILSTSG